MGLHFHIFGEGGKGPEGVFRKAFGALEGLTRPQENQGRKGVRAVASSWRTLYVELKGLMRPLRNL